MAATEDRQSCDKLTKAQIVERIYEDLPVSKRNIQRVIDLFVDEIKQGLASMKTVELRGFGTFEVKERKSRRARNPKTGEKVTVESHGVTTFRPGKELKEQSWSLRV